MIDVAVPQDYVNETTLAAFGGATGVILGVSVALRRAIGLNHPVVPFLAAIVISYASAISKAVPSTLLAWLISFLNACLLFSPLTAQMTR